MRNVAAPIYFTWLAVAFRWLVWLALLASALMSSASGAWLWLFPGFGLWYLFQSRLELISRGAFPIRLLSSAADLLFVYLLIFFGGTSFSWAGLLPVFTTGLTLGNVGLGLVAILSFTGLALGQILLNPSGGILLFLAWAAIVFLSAVLLVLALKPWLLQAVQYQQRNAGKANQDSQRLIDRRRRALISLLAEISTTNGEGRVYAVALDAAIAALGLVEPTSPGLAGAFWRLENGAGNKYRVHLVTSRDLPGLEQELLLTGNGGLLERAMAEGELRRTTDIIEDPDLSRISGLQTFGSACVLRLDVDGEPGALLMMAHPDPDFFTEERGEILELVARQAAITVRQAKLLQKSSSEKARVLEIEEEARRQLARDLHDGPTQSIAALAMRVNFARRMFDRDSQSAVEELRKVEELARDITREMRHLLFMLRPLVLESHGLEAALIALADKLQEAYQHTLAITVDPEVLPRLSVDKHVAIFYIVEEAVNLSRKLAGAGHTWVRLIAPNEEQFLLEIEDDGALPTGDGSDRTSQILRERAALIEGMLTVQALPEAGARVSLLASLSPVPASDSASPT